jgi:phosphate transport system substrate-binding protein
MNKQNRTNMAGLRLLSTSILVIVAIGWSIGLIGKGLGQLGRESNSKTTPVREIPDSFALVPNVATGVFPYGGSTAWAPLRLLVDSAIQAERPELQLRYVQPQKEPPGSRTGIQMLLNGQLTFAQTSYPLRQEEYDRAKQLGFRLKQIPVAVSGIAVVVHPNLNIAGLTLDQLRLIYSGQITNWREVGGPELQIKPYSRPASTGDAVELFEKHILREQKFGSNVQYVATTTEALRQLAKERGGIYYASAPALLPQCTVKPLPLGQNPEGFIPPYQEPLVTSDQCPNRRNRLNLKAFQTARYPLTHHLYVVIKQNDGIEERVGEAYANFLLTPQGQKLIAEARFVPLRRSAF